MTSDHNKLGNILHTLCRHFRCSLTEANLIYQQPLIPDDETLLSNPESARSCACAVGVGVTMPPSSTEADGIVAFERMLADAGEPSARLNHMVDLLVAGGTSSLRD